MGVKAIAPLQEEANRPLPDHLALQLDLQRLGYLPANGQIDGQFAVVAAQVRWFRHRAPRCRIVANIVADLRRL